MPDILIWTSHHGASEGKGIKFIKPSKHFNSPIYYLRKGKNVLNLEGGMRLLKFYRYFLGHL